MSASLQLLVHFVQQPWKGHAHDAGGIHALGPRWPRDGRSNSASRRRPWRLRGPGPADHEPERRQEPGTGLCGTRAVPTWLAAVFRVGRYAEDLPGRWTNGSTVACGCSSSSSGNAERPSTGSSAAGRPAERSRAWGHVSRRAGGMLPPTKLSKSPCPANTSSPSEWFVWSDARYLNSPNRRMRTRMSGGVGGGQPGSPAAPYPDRRRATRPATSSDGSLDRRMS